MSVWLISWLTGQFTFRLMGGPRAAGSSVALSQLPTTVYSQVYRHKTLESDRISIEPAMELGRGMSKIWTDPDPWMNQEFELRKPPAGREARRDARAYSVAVQPDGSFAIDEVLPGSYELSVGGDPLRFDPIQMSLLAGVYKLGSPKRKNSSVEWAWNATWVCMS
jgi:hypothetical protein